MSTKRNELLDKVRALMSKTTANGCTEAEALAALAKARAMIDAYVITDDELQLSKTEAAELRTDDDETDPHGIKWRLNYEIGEFCGVTIFRRGDGRFVFVGMRSDVDLAQWLLDHLTDYVTAELVKHLMFSLAPKSERRKIIKSFVQGATETINDKLTNLCERSAAERTANGNALVVVKSTAIADKLKEAGINLKTSCSGGSSNVDSGAYDAGGKAGKKATIGRPVSAGGALRLGKS